MGRDQLIFVHLSDIHFTKKSGDSFDLDRDTRTQVENDLTTLLQAVGSPTGILVTGDVAYSGKRDEYDRATDWLSRLCDRIGCPPESVWVIPGNHDVDRATVDASKMLRDVRSRVRQTSLDQLDKEIEEILTDAAYSRIALTPTKEYVRFASRFGCEISAPNRLSWTAVFKLDDEVELQMHGLTSTIFSDKHDNREENKLVLGSFQAVKEQQDGVMHMALCHHPPDWLRDGDSVTHMLNLRVDIQMFGHKHVHRVQHIDYQNVHETVILSSGAMHPERGEQDWTPRYNVLTVHTETEDTDRKLVLRIFPRTWDSDSMRFTQDKIAEEDGSITYRLPLPAAKADALVPPDGAKSAEAVANVESRTEETEAEMDENSTEGYHDIGPARHLTYRFLTLHYHEIMRIAADLDLLRDDDEGLRDHEVYKRIFQRAKHSEKLADLWDAVETNHDNGRSAPNPFK